MEWDTFNLARNFRGKIHGPGSWEEQEPFPWSLKTLHKKRGKGRARLSQQGKSQTSKGGGDTRQIKIDPR